MNGLKRYALIGLLFAQGAFAENADPGASVARVNDVDIPRAEFDAELHRALAAGAASGAALESDVRNRLIARELLWQKASAAGFGTAASAGIAVGREARMVAIDAYADSRVTPIEPGEAALRARYDDIVARLGPREYRLSVIQTSDHEALRVASARLIDGADFAREARAISRVPSARRGGEIGWYSFPVPVDEGRTNGLPPAIARAVIALQPGHTSAAIDTGDGWAIVRVDAIRDTLVPAYAEVRETLRTALKAQSMQAQIRQLVLDLLRHARVRVPD